MIGAVCWQQCCFFLCLRFRTLSAPRVLWSKVGGTVHDASGWNAEDAFDSRDKCVAKITRIKQQFDPDHLSTWYAVGKETQKSDTRARTALP